MKVVSSFNYLYLLYQNFIFHMNNIENFNVLFTIKIKMSSVIKYNKILNIFVSEKIIKPIVGFLLF